MNKKVLIVILVLAGMFMIYMHPEPDYVFNKDDVILIETSLFCGDRVTGRTLYPFVIISDCVREELRERLLEHEYVHIRQIRQEGWVFYFKYAYYNIENFFANLSWYLEYCYGNNPYEIEAYSKKKP